ncbi:hypothetical protein A8950_1254 [Dongia mobilis]|uniref:Uncharacterized protein n=1 Tax=Dongia mobilis TaxID=578943 RepID=A0A4R6WV66_9PROT|nr:hypothetical protein [Dongia mobilis]TDQ82972.1 hypothetical protein A8950_1254 [Dongia mobilis]
MINPRQLAGFVVAPVLAAFALTVPSALGNEFELGGNTTASQVLPANVIAGRHYRIADKVVSDGLLYTYTVESEFGTFRPTGNYALQKILTEIQVIAALQEISRTEAFADSVLHAAKSPLRFGASMITDPVDTVTGIPRGLFSIFENVAESATSDANPSEDARIKQALMVSSWKREYCAEMGCDVYSSNKVLQEELNRIGWAAAIGGLAVSGATTAASGGAVMAFSLVRTSDQLNEALRSEPPSRLRIINEGKLHGLGVPDELAQKFLDHPAYTPRHATLIVSALEALQGVKGIERYLELCLRAQDEVGANFYQNSAEILRGYHLSAARLVELMPLLGIAAASAENGRIVISLAWDNGVYDPAIAQRIDYGRQEFEKAGFRQGFDIWTTGTASPRLKAELAKRGFALTDFVGRKVPITQ